MTFVNKYARTLTAGVLAALLLPGLIASSCTLLFRERAPSCSDFWDPGPQLLG